MKEENKTTIKVFETVKSINRKTPDSPFSPAFKISCHFTPESRDDDNIRKNEKQFFTTLYFELINIFP